MYYCQDKDDVEYTYFGGPADQIIKETYPIKMPYMPSLKKIKVVTSEFLFDPKNGDFDTAAVWYCITPDDQKVEINRFLKECDHEFKEISKDEYDERNKYLNDQNK